MNAEQRLRAQYRREMRMARLFGDDAFAEEIHAEYCSDPSNAEEIDHSNFCIWMDQVAAAIPDPMNISDPTPPPTTQPDHIMQFFAFEHLPRDLQLVSRPFGELANNIVESVPRNAERTVALRKLLEAKDAAVRASIAK